jgi:spore coat polysaccharide biosynthesis protein SpsF
MGASRLFGKVMMNMAGRSLLAYLVERISKARMLDSIVVATTTNPQDNFIIEECERHGIPNFRSGEFDVLSRYVSAARACQADIIVRVTADNPFTDPASIDRVVETIVREAADYATENRLPAGVAGEALTRQALAFIDSVAATKPLREHVTLYAKENPQALHCAFLEPRPACDRPDLSFAVDTLDEYLYAREIARRFPNPDFELESLIAMADSSAGAIGEC